MHTNPMHFDDGSTLDGVVEAGIQHEERVLRIIGDKDATGNVVDVPVRNDAIPLEPVHQEDSCAVQE